MRRTGACPHCIVDAKGLSKMPPTILGGPHFCLGDQLNEKQIVERRGRVQ
jgi:hypothetical protein